MIGKLVGRIDYKATDHILLDVKGVGYLVYVSERTLSALPGPGEYTSLFTDLLVREDLLQLFGFPTLAEKEWHRLLMSVQGIGAKASTAILGALGPDGISRAIAIGDWNAVKAAPGVGPKIAQRVVNELKDKAPSVMAMGDMGATGHAPGPEDDVIETVPPMQATPAAATGQNGGSLAQARSEALSALQNLGYGPGDAAAAIAQASDALDEVDTTGLIREALKRLAPKG